MTYASYVWSSYAIVTISLVLFAFTARKRHHRTLKRLERWFKKVN